LTFHYSRGVKKKGMTNVTRVGCFERSAAGAAKSVPYSLSFPPLWQKIFSTKLFEED